jgi:hypothetical protein
MKRCFAFVLIAIAFGAQDGFGLSETLHTPKIFWPKNYDTNKAEQVHRVLNSTNFHYLEGMTSYWEPKWSTTLVYDGDAKTLSAFITALNAINGIDVRLTFSRDLSAEAHSSLPAGTWWVEYSHTRPDTMTIRVNLAAEFLKGDKFELRVPKPKR